MQIIIVSDYSEQIAALRALALGAGAAKAEGFSHPAAALDWCESHEPDLVVVDFAMRACDGLEFLRRFRALPHLAAVPLMLIVPDGYGRLKAAALELGATDFLTSPADTTEFVARTRNLLALRSARLPVQHTNLPGAADGEAGSTRAHAGRWAIPVPQVTPTGVHCAMH